MKTRLGGNSDFEGRCRVDGNFRELLDDAWPRTPRSTSLHQLDWDSDENNDPRKRFADLSRFE